MRADDRIRKARGPAPGIVRASAVAIPASLQKNAQVLQPIANRISVKDMVSAAAMLGIFEGALDFKKFQPYAAIADVPAEGSVPSEKDVRVSLGFLSRFGGFIRSRLGGFIRHQKAILDRLNSILLAKPKTKLVKSDERQAISDKQELTANSLPLTASDTDFNEEALRQAVDQEGFLESQVVGAPNLPQIEQLTPENLGIDLAAAPGAPPPPEQPTPGVIEGEATSPPNEFLETPVALEAPATQEKLNAAEIRTLKKQLKEQQKQQKQLSSRKIQLEKKEEEEWREEAERREKAKAEKKERAQQGVDEAAELRSRMLAKVGPQKQSKIQQILTSLNYMGMGKERVSFLDNLGTMMEAGLPLMDAVKSLQRETRNRQMRKLLGRMVVAVETGSPLWRAMDAQYFFHPQEIAMVRVGEEAGNLVDNLQYLAEQERKDRNLRGKVKTAMIYPAIILVMLTVIVLGLGMFVLPNLVQVIFSLGVPLPFVTRMIIKFTNLFTVHGATIIPGTIVGMIVFVLLTKFTSFKIIVQWVLFKVPGIGALLREATLSRFGVIMGGLLSAGVPVTDALQSMANVTTLARYRKFYFQLLERVRLGDSFATSFRAIRLTDKCFPPSLQQLVVTGEQSGSLTKIMLKSADIHDRRATEIAEKLPVILEPMLLLIIGAMVGTIALGILMPIYSVVGNVGGA